MSSRRPPLSRLHCGACICDLAVCPVEHEIVAPAVRPPGPHPPQPWPGMDAVSVGSAMEVPTAGAWRSVPHQMSRPSASRVGIRPGRTPASTHRSQSNGMRRHHRVGCVLEPASHQAVAHTKCCWRVGWGLGPVAPQRPHAPVQSSHVKGCCPTAHMGTGVPPDRHVVRPRLGVHPWPCFRRDRKATTRLAQTAEGMARS